ncbi:hypothetical protein CCP3SC1AL1_1420007 [Gammaproteobacteria bacterium]
MREFISEFRGLRATAKQKAVATNAGLSGACLHDCLGWNIDQAAVKNVDRVATGKQSGKAGNLGSSDKSISPLGWSTIWPSRRPCSYNPSLVVQNLGCHLCWRWHSECESMGKEDCGRD